MTEARPTLGVQPGAFKAFWGTEPPSAWEPLARQHPWGSVYHTAGWGAVLATAFRHMQPGYVLPADDPSGGPGIPICRVSSPVLGRRWVAVPFGTWCDPLAENPAAVGTLLAGLRGLAAADGCRSLLLKCLWSTNAVTEAGFRVQRHFKCHFIPLEPTPEVVFRRCSENIRQRVRKAARLQIQAVERNTADDLTVFHRILNTNRRRLGLPAIPMDFFRALSRRFGRDCLVYTAVSAENPQAVLLCVRHGTTTYLEYAGDLEEARPSGAGQFLYWTAIERAMADGCTRFCLGRSDPDNEGLIRYKRFWGAEEKDIAVFDLLETREGPAPVAARGRLARQLFRWMPGPAYRSLSRWLYRHWA